MGFEASPEMLSLTGMSHDQFVDLMGGLNYKVENIQREKENAVEKTLLKKRLDDDVTIRKYYTFIFRKGMKRCCKKILYGHEEEKWYSEKSKRRNIVKT